MRCSIWFKKINPWCRIDCRESTSCM